jgi:hypothetical protein
VNPTLLRVLELQTPAIRPYRDATGTIFPSPHTAVKKHGLACRVSALVNDPRNDEPPCAEATR